MNPFILAILQTALQAGAQKAMAPSGGPAGANPLSQPVGFLDGLMKQPQSQTPPLQPQQFNPIQFQQRRY